MDLQAQRIKKNQVIYLSVSRAINFVNINALLYICNKLSMMRLCNICLTGWWGQEEVMQVRSNEKEEQLRINGESKK